MLKPNANRGTMLEKTIVLTDWLTINVPERTVPDSYTKRAAGTCFTIVGDHQGAIVHLIENGHPSPAFSLARSVYEGFIRGSWFLFCATEAQADDYLDEKKLSSLDGTELRIGDLIKALEHSNNFKKDSLKAIHDSRWKELCDFAHMGGRLVNHWNTSKAIEANFTAKEVDDVLILTVLYAALAAISMVQLAESESEKDAKHIEEIYEQLKAYHWHP
jgi:hypothetical protein